MSFIPGRSILRLASALMRLTASDFITFYRPTRCELRVALRHHRVAEAAPGPYDEVLSRLRHERFGCNEDF
jgi:hypothetical protein